MDTQALWLTLRLALSTTALLLALAVPVAWWIASGTGVARAAVQSVVGLPLVLPPTVLGFYLLVAMGPLTPFGRALTHMLGHPLAFSFVGLLAGSMIYSLPFAIQPLVGGFHSMAGIYLEAAEGLGMTRNAAFFRVLLPMARGAVLTSAVLTFTHTVGEFGVVLMVGGNIPGVTRTLSISLYDQVQDFNYAGANRTALLLVVVSVLGLLAIYLRAGSNGERRRAELV